jgi:predicted PurR-regulated permease PerM
MIERKHLNVDSDSAARLLILPLWLLAIYALGALMNEAATICLWVVCAFFLFVLLDPVAEFLKSKRWPTALAAVFLVLVASSIIAVSIYVLGYLFSGMVVELEQSKKIFLQSFDSLNSSWHLLLSRFSGFHPSAPSTNPDVSKVEIVQNSPLSAAMSGTILHGVGNAVTVLTFALLVPILGFFFLAERDAFGKVMAAAYRDPKQAALTWRMIVKSTRAFFVGNLVLGLITYPLFILLFWLFAVPSTFSVAALATVFNLVPFAGAILSGFLPAVALYTQTQSFGAPLALYGCCIGIHFVIADFVTPKILGSQVNINATTSTIALVAWGELWGGVGLILAIPLTSLIKIMFEHSNFFWLQWIAGLMSEDVDHALEGRSS